LNGSINLIVFGDPFASAHTSLADCAYEQAHALDTA